MDMEKCRTLKAELRPQTEAQVVPIGRFFDGNDDPASIGCNLIEHPGIAVFRDALVALTRRPDIEAVYARISELDPGEESWPFTDTVLVAGDIPADELRTLVAPLQPDEVGCAADFQVPASILERHRGRVLAVWWD